MVFWHILAKFNGVTKVQKVFVSIGINSSTRFLEGNCNGVISFNPIPGKVSVVPDEVLKDLSRDQLIIYRYELAIHTGPS